MNRKRNLIFLLIVSFISGFGYISACNGVLKLADTDMEWGINVGDKFTWKVSQSNQTKGFLPKGSKFEITITAIENLTISPGVPIDLIRANFSVYNSITKLTSEILSNGTFEVFDTTFNNTYFYAPFYDHGFFMPLDYYAGFSEGFMDYLFNVFSFNVFTYGYVNETYKFGAYNTTRNMLYLWEFNENLVTETLTIYQGSLDNIQYLLVLVGTSSGSSIPFGNYYLLAFGISLSATTYFVYKKKFTRKKR